MLRLVPPVPILFPMFLSPLSYKRFPGALAVLCGTLTLSLTVSAAPLEPILFSGLGSYKRKVSTDSPEAQKWFNLSSL